MEVRSENECCPVNRFLHSLTKAAVKRIRRWHFDRWKCGTFPLPVWFSGNYVSLRSLSRLIGRSDAVKGWVWFEYLWSVERLESPAPTLFMNWMGLGDCSPGLPFPLVLAVISASGSEVAESLSKICK